MFNAAVVAASCSALQLAPHIEKATGLSGKDFIQTVMSQFAEMGVPGAAGMFETRQNPIVGSAPAFAALTQDFGPVNGR